MKRPCHPSTQTRRTVLLVALGLALTACSGRGAVTATHVATTNRVATWSIAYEARRGGDSEIYEMKADGSGSVALTENDVDDDLPSWSPDGSEIAFTRRSASGTDIYIVDAAGSGEVRLTKDGASSRPAWAPDGKRIAFTRGGDIYVINVDGTGQKRLTSTKKPASSGAPAWSPDGRRIAYLSDRDRPETPALYVMASDGSHEVRLTHGSAGEGPPVWSPDGKQIAFSRFDIYVINADGTEERALPGNVRTNDIDPAWSPDARLIVFIREGASGGGGVYVVGSDGSELRRLAKYGFSADSPTWAPEGQTVVFGRGSIEGSEIVAVDVATGTLRTLLREGDPAFPAVSPH